MYEYRAEIVSVYDGDTCRADIDLGFYTTLKSVEFRLLGINAPERRGETLQAANVSRDNLRAMILGKRVRIVTKKDEQEKYGRWLATIYVADGDVEIDVNRWMVNHGYAVPYMV